MSAGLAGATASGWDEAAARTIIDSSRAQEGPLLPVLHALQQRFGAIDARAIPLIADALNISRAEVHGVVSFYHDFRTHEAGRHVVKLCRAEACQAAGCEAIVEALSRLDGLSPGTTTADGAITLESVYCLGHCAVAPAALVDGEPAGLLDIAGLRDILAGLRGAVA